MKRTKFPVKFLNLCRSITAKRPKTVIDHILKHGHVTTEELKDKYGYNHPPRAARDVKEQGIPIEMFRVIGSDGRKIAAYRFGDPTRLRFGAQFGRTRFSADLKKSLIERYGAQCSIYCSPFPERELQIDHRIPFEVAGDGPDGAANAEEFMLVCGSANRAKSWSCEHCANWQETKRSGICRECYWAYPEKYSHVAMRAVRRVDILWSEAEVADYEALKCKTEKLQKNIPSYVKDILRERLRD